MPIIVADSLTVIESLKLAFQGPTLDDLAKMAMKQFDTLY